MVRSSGWCLLLTFVALSVVPFLDRVGGVDDDGDFEAAEPSKLIVVDLGEYASASHVPVPILGDTNPLGISQVIFFFFLTVIP
jgi:hypothetical protein